jgi:Activator of Hsp90 ATPase homolog 1-like protein
MTLPPIIKTVTVPLAPDRAFDLFTRRMGEWWPLATHAVSSALCKAPARGVVVPPHVGGIVQETLADGSLAAWGTVTEYSPGTGFAMTWHPGNDPVEATLVTLRFVPVKAGTEVTLTHSGWENRPDGASARKSYVGGWEGVLGQDYADFAAALVD